MTYGAGIFALGEISRLENAARHKSDDDIISAKRAENQFVFRVKSQIHGFRSSLYSRKIVEDQLIAALKAENANHPLASKEAVEAAISDERTKALFNPEVIKYTYPDGYLPDGVVAPPDHVWNVY